MINNSFHPHVWFRNSHDVFRFNIVSPEFSGFWGFIPVIKKHRFNIHYPNLYPIPDSVISNLGFV